MLRENSDPFGTCQSLERYCSQYPQDRMASQYYARVLIKVGRLDDAEIELNRLERLIALARIEKRNAEEIIAKDENCLRGTKLNLLAWQKKYQEALDYLNQFRESIEQTNEETSLIEEFCKHQLGKSQNDSNRAAHYYRTRQINDYQESDFLYHMQTRHLSQSNNQQEEDCAVFESDFPFNAIYAEVKRIIKDLQIASNQEAKRLNWHFPMNLHIFKYPKCGRKKGTLVDYFAVVAISETDNIITMYPSFDGQNIPHFDLSHMLPPSNNPQGHARTKGPSRTDRFKKRFGLK